MRQPSQINTSPSDADLLGRYQAGEQAAFDALIRRYGKELFNFLAKFLGDAALADDVFQDTFLQVHLSAGTFDTSRRFKPWLFTIAANKARDAMRSRQRRQAAALDAAVHDGDETTSYATLMPSDVPGPDEVAVNHETRDNVENIIRAMPENLRAVLLLCYFHDMPYKDVADALSVPLGTVKSRLHAAVAYFAEKWKGSQTRE